LTLETIGSAKKQLDIFPGYLTYTERQYMHEVCLGRAGASSVSSGRGVTLQGTVTRHRNTSQHLHPSMVPTLLAMTDITKVDGRIDLFNIHEN
jgi:hypothetical protein